MRYTPLLRIFGLLLMFFSLSMLPPLGVAFYYQDHDWYSFVVSFFATFSVGLLLWSIFHKHKQELKTRDGFLLVVMLWMVLSLFGSIPFLMQLYPKFSFTDALFETVSGISTTGATVLTHLDRLPRALLYYRQQLHFLGGMGIIVLAVAVMPMLGVGGMQLYRAETVGPNKTAKLKPRIAETAKVLWYIYVGLVILCAFAYWACGMTVFDAIGESFSTIATGGFSIHDASFAYYHSHLIDLVCVFFMIIGGTNFGLHFYFLQRRRFSVYTNDAEFAAYFKIICFATLVCVVMLTIYHTVPHNESFIDSLFTSVSILTTTGLTITNFSIWPTFLPDFLMFIALLGGCAASTSGGIKIIRFSLLRKQGQREIKRLIHPQSVSAIKFGGEVLPERIIESIWAFIALFVVVFVILLLALLSTGLNLTTAFGSLAACISNAGASIGKSSHTFESLPTFAKWVCITAMLGGRLELFTLLVLFSPDYWRK